MRQQASGKQPNRCTGMPTLSCMDIKTPDAAQSERDGQCLTTAIFLSSKFLWAQATLMTMQSQRGLNKKTLSH